MKTIITNAQIVNEGRIFKGAVAIRDALIEKIIEKPSAVDLENFRDYSKVDANDKFLIPGVIDDQVHFRDPGLTYKGDIYTESRAAVAGGITSFMEMPNTVPNTLTQELLEEKYLLGSQKSLANYSFYMGASNDNLEEVVKTDPATVCGIKVFMGSSTGNMLVDDPETLKGIFRDSPCLVAVHCEDEKTVQYNIQAYREKFGENLPFHLHPEIRCAEACYRSSSLAVELAEKYKTRLHVLHLSTAREMALFSSKLSLEHKKITAEVCIHHLWFSEEDYHKKGAFIKWNPAIKTKTDRDALFEAVLENKIDIVATDHAPHTLEEKNNPYFKAPSGGPLVQHSLVAMLEFHRKKKISLEMVVKKMCHAPAICFQVKNRGFIREGYFADLVLVDLNQPWTVNKSNVLYKCGWSPFEDTTFHSTVLKTFVNGNLVYDQGRFDESFKGQRLEFERG